MKKYLLFLMCLIGLASFVSAQTSNSGAIIMKVATGNALGVDTLGAADTIYLTSPTLASVGLSGNYAIAITGVTITGVFSCTATLESSIDGVVWSPGVNRVPGTDGIKSDTLIISSSGTKFMTVASGAAKQVLASGVVVNTYYTDVARRYFIRVKLLSPAPAQSTRVYARLITQN